MRQMKWPGADAFRTDGMGPGGLYAAGAIKALCDYVAPLAAFADAAATASAADVAAAARVASDEYARARPLLLSNRVCHAAMVPVQRAALLCLFLGMLRVWRQCAVRPAAHAWAYAGVQPPAEDGTWTIRQWARARDAVVETLELVGGTPMAADCWTLLWLAFAELLIGDDEDVEDDGAVEEEGEELAATAPAAEALDLLAALGVATDAAMLAAVAAQRRLPLGARFDDDRYCGGWRDEVGPRLPLPLPFQEARGRRRLTAFFVCEAESVYFAYAARLAVLHAFELAARRRPAVCMLEQLRPALQTSAGETLLAFLRSLAAKQDTISGHYWRDQVGRNLVGAHLWAGESDRHALRMFQSAGPLATAADVPPSPHAMEILAEMRPLEYKRVHHYTTEPTRVMPAVVDEFLAQETAALAAWTPAARACASERMGWLAVTRLLDAEVAAWPLAALLTPCAWLDELEHARPALASEAPPFATPAEALERTPQTQDAGCCVVRLLRQTFVVVATAAAPQPLTLAVPDVASAVAVWLTFHYGLAQLPPAASPYAALIGELRALV